MSFFKINEVIKVEPILANKRCRAWLASLVQKGNSTGPYLKLTLSRIRLCRVQPGRLRRT